MSAFGFVTLRVFPAVLCSALPVIVVIVEQNDKQSDTSLGGDVLEELFASEVLQCSLVIH